MAASAAAATSLESDSLLASVLTAAARTHACTQTATHLGIGAWPATWWAATCSCWRRNCRFLEDCCCFAALLLHGRGNRKHSPSGAHGHSVARARGTRGSGDRDDDDREQALSAARSQQSEPGEVATPHDGAARRGSRAVKEDGDRAPVG